MVMHQEIINKDEEIGKLRSSLKKVTDESAKLKEEVEHLKKAQVSLSIQNNRKQYAHSFLQQLKRVPNVLYLMDPKP